MAMRDLSPRRGGIRGYNGRVSIPFRAIVFDFDGLIVDTEQPIYEAYSTIFA